MDIFSRIKELNLPIGKYVVYGSGVLEAHGIRKANDVDLVVDDDLYQELKNRGWKRKILFSTRMWHCKALSDGKGNEAYTNLKWRNYNVKTPYLIENAEVINGIPFMQLKSYLDYKKILPRDKDKRDVDLIQNYFSRKS
jgi:hypothetical protein